MSKKKIIGDAWTDTSGLISNAGYSDNILAYANDSDFDAIITELRFYALNTNAFKFAMYTTSSYAIRDALVRFNTAQSMTANAWNVFAVPTPFTVSDGVAYGFALFRDGVVSQGAYATRTDDGRYRYINTGQDSSIVYADGFAASYTQAFTSYTGSLPFQAYGYAKPVITSINSGSGITVGQTGVALVGTDLNDYADSAADPVLQFANTSAFDDVVVNQTRNSYDDDGINFDVVSTGLTPGSTIYARVVSGLGQTSDTYSLTLSSAGNSCNVSAALSSMGADVTASQTNAVLMSAAVSTIGTDITVAQQNAAELSASIPTLGFDAVLAQQNAALVSALLPSLGADIVVTQQNAALISAAIPSLLFDVITTSGGDNFCVISASIPSPGADVVAAQTNAALLSAAVPPVGADIVVEQHNIATVSAALSALGFDVVLTQENAVELSAGLVGLQCNVEVTQKNAAALSAAIPSLEFDAAALVGNVAVISAAMPSIGFDAVVTQENAAEVSAALPPIIADIIIVSEEEEDAGVIWRDTRRIELKQVPYGSDTTQLAFDVPPTWNVAALTDVDVQIADRAGTEVLASSACTLWPASSLDDEVTQYDNTLVLASGATAPLAGDMITIKGDFGNENVLVKSYESTTRTVTTETPIQADYESGAIVYGNIISYDVDVSDTDVFTVGKSFVATWTPTGTGIPFKTILQITKFEANTASIEHRFQRLYSRAYAAFKKPVDRFNDMVDEARDELQFEMRGSNLDFERIVGEPVVTKLIMAKMACLWLLGTDEDLEDERKHISTEYARLFAILKSLPIWTDTDQDGIEDTGEVSSHNHIFGRSW